MTPTISLSISAGKLGNLTAEIERKLGQIVRKTALDLSAEAKQRAAVDTGAMRASIFVVTAEENTQPEAISAAAGLMPEPHHSHHHHDPPVFTDPIPAQGPLEAVVGVGAEYGIYVEMGTHKMHAQPFFTPASQTVQEPFEAALRAVLGESL